MSNSTADRRGLIIRDILSKNDDITDGLINNSKRISKTLGFCDVGETLTDLITQLLKAAKENEDCFNTIVKTVNTSLESLSKTKNK